MLFNTHYTMFLFYFLFCFHRHINNILDLIRAVQDHVLNRIPSSKTWFLYIIIQKWCSNFLFNSKDQQYHAQTNHQTYSEQQNRLSVGHFHKDCFVVLEILGLNLWNLKDMYFDILSSNWKRDHVIWTRIEQTAANTKWQHTWMVLLLPVLNIKNNKN